GTATNPGSGRRSSPGSATTPATPTATSSSTTSTASRTSTSATAASTWTGRCMSWCRGSGNRPEEPLYLPPARDSHMEVHVGTSGWAYAWNRGGSLAWFAEHSGLDAIELNASFYGFPSEKSVLSWADAGSGLRWSIKVNRSVTHRHRFNEKAVAVWERFRERFLPLDDLVDFYLFQAPPAF